VSEKGDIKQIDRQLGGTRCIILCPTRELATQTVEVVEKLCSGSFSWLVAGCLSGGEKRKSEKARLRKGISILVATPGRLLDHLGKTESLLMSLKGKLEWLVLDEADRLLDMGLGGQVEQIVQHVRANQPGSGRDGVTWRSILVSATVSPKVEELAKKLLGGSEWVWARGSKDKETQDLGLSESTPRQLSQLHMTVTAKLRLVTLVAFLVERIKKNERIVVFMSTCDGVDYHHALFQAMDCILQQDKETDSNSDTDQGGIFGSACDVFKLHGSVPHAERQVILKKFNGGGGDEGNTKRAALLLATDVAARGLNLPGVDWTVQYDPPCEIADYAHRAGRAARAGKAGHSLLFLLPSEKQFLDVLQLKGVSHVAALSLASTLNHAGDICTDLTASGKKYAGGGLSSKSGEAFSTELQRRLEEKIIEDDAAAKAAHKNKDEKRKKGQPREQVFGPLLEAARKAYMSYLRSYPTKEKAVRHIFCTRALHLGHMARSFALKEQPTQLVNKSKKATTAVEDDIEANNNKRNSNLAFEERILADVVEEVSRKRLKKSSSTMTKSNSVGGSSIDTGKARQILMARAVKLQDGGMDSF
jgi:ATP-dependent RNA helicase DDX31/DBP7